MSNTTPGTGPDPDETDDQATADRSAVTDESTTSSAVPPTDHEPSTDATAVDEGGTMAPDAVAEEQPHAAPDAVADESHAAPATAADDPHAAPVAEPQSENSTAQLDAAVERSRSVGGDDADAPSTAAPSTAAPEAQAATSAPFVATTTDQPLAPEPGYAAPQAVYVQAPTEPKTKGNRGFGVLVALIGAVVFAALYAGAAYLILLVTRDAVSASTVFVEFLAKPVYWAPVLFFFLAYTLLAAIVNRGPSWTYAVFGIFVAAIVYFSYIGGALLTVAWDISPDQVGGFVNERWLDPFAIVAFIIAREIPIWFSGWLAARGRKVTARNQRAYEAYERELAAGPQSRP